MSNTAAELHDKVEARIDDFLKSQAAKPDTTKRVLIGVLVITVAVDIGWDVLKAWLF